jgi:hypothetical protein
MPRAGARPSARSVGWPVRMASRWDWTTRSAAPTSCGRCIEFGRRSDRSRSRAARACRATDRSTKTGVVQDPGGRRERPSVSRDPRNGAVGRRPTCAMCRWGVSRLTIGMRCKRLEGSTPSASMRTQALFDNRWSGKNSNTQHSNTVERRRPAWHGAMGRGLTRLPLLGAPAAPSRRRRTTHEAIAQW